MQKANSTSDGNSVDMTNDSQLADLSSQPFTNPIHSPTTQSPMDFSEFNSLYPSAFLSKTNSVSVTLSNCFFDDDASRADETPDRLCQDNVILEYQQLYNRYTLCLAQLQESIKEADAIRVQNDNIRLANADLIQRLSLLSDATIQNCLLSSGHSSPSLIYYFNSLTVGGNPRDIHVTEEVPNVSPTSVITNNRSGRRYIGRVSLPASISVRSRGHLQAVRNGTIFPTQNNQYYGNNVGPSRGASGQQVTKAIQGGSVS